MKRFESYLEPINRRLTQLLPLCTYDAPEVCDAMRYSVDGGGNAETIPLAAKAGANMFVAGSYLFAQADMKAAVDDLRRGSAAAAK